MKEEILPNKIEDIQSVNNLLKQIDAFEQEQELLFALSTDITKVREKDDLIRLFASRLRNMFYFLHSIVMLVDQHSKTFKPFLLNPESSPIADHPQYPEIVKMVYPIDAPLVRDVIHSQGPVTYLLEQAIKIPGIPPFIKVNYERGIREVMITPLRSKTEVMGFILLYSNTTNSFTNEFKQVLNGIAPQLSNAISNIIINEGNLQKDHQNEVLLSLSREVVTVRTRPHLLGVINNNLKKLIGFTHSVMTVLADDGQTYKAFLTDQDSPTKDYSNYNEIISLSYPVQDDIYDMALAADKPLVFDIRAFDLSKAPQWLNEYSDQCTPAFRGKLHHFPRA